MCKYANVDPETISRGFNILRWVIMMTMKMSLIVAGGVHNNNKKKKYDDGNFETLFDA